jgi:hypothetical protein
MRLPTELRLVVWRLSTTPRILHYSRAAAKRTKLQLDHVVPPVLHTCQESRAVGLEIYALGQLATQRLYLSLEFDTLLWMRYNRYGGPRTFSVEARKFLHDNTGFSVQNLAISTNYWDSIVSGDPELYIKIRTEVKFERLTIVDEFSRWLNWARVAGAELRLSEIKAAVEQRDVLRRLRESDSTLWRRWDSRAGEKYPDLKSSEIRFAEVIFMDKGQEIDPRSRRH